MKKRSCIWGVMFCLIFCVLPVRADVIWEPEDSFYRDHEEGCTYVNRRFTADGPDGRVIVYRSPESPKEVCSLENGTETWISYTYQDRDGILWGVYEDGDDTGWLPMDYMRVVYDYISFEAEYGEEFVEQSGVLGQECQGKEICFWQYPGSDEYSAVTIDWQNMPEYRQVYVDEKGHSWGFVGYYYARKNFWVCVDAPAAGYEELYPDGGPGIGVQGENGDVSDLSSGRQGTDGDALGQASGQQEGRIVPKVDRRLVLITTALVVAVVLVTAGLLLVWKKKD